MFRRDRPTARTACRTGRRRVLIRPLTRRGGHASVSTAPTTGACAPDRTVASAASTAACCRSNRPTADDTPRSGTYRPMVHDRRIVFWVHRSEGWRVGPRRFAVAGRRSPSRSGGAVGSIRIAGALASRAERDGGASRPPPESQHPLSDPIGAPSNGDFVVHRGDTVRLVGTDCKMPKGGVGPRVGKHGAWPGQNVTVQLPCIRVCSNRLASAGYKPAREGRRRVAGRVPDSISRTRNSDSGSCRSRRFSASATAAEAS